jgi:hypothetical protein
MTGRGKLRRGAVVAGGLAAVASLFLSATAVYGLISPPGQLSVQAAKALERGNPVKAESLARQALLKAPMDVRALRVLGFVAAGRNDVPKAQQLMGLADKDSRRDLQSQAWLFDHDLRTGDLTDAFRHADAILRVEPQLAGKLFPVLTSVVSDARAVPPAVESLNGLPPWRTDFLMAVANKADPSITFALLSQLNLGPEKPTDGELGAYLNKLMAANRYDEALLGWLLFLPPDRLDAFRGVYDGDFDRLPGPMPFNWLFQGGVGADMEIEKAPSRPHDQALHVTYDGFSNTPLISQVSILPPGEHSLSIEAYYDTPEAANNLEWRVFCLNSGEILLRMKIQADASWKKYSKNFTVPATGCEAQRVGLAVVPGEHRTSLSTWYDKVRIEKAAPALEASL